MTQLITDDERAKLLATGQGTDALPVVRLFTPDAHATWLLAALDPADGDTAWGLIDLGIGMPGGRVELLPVSFADGCGLFLSQVIECVGHLEALKKLRRH